MKYIAMTTFILLAALALPSAVVAQEQTQTRPNILFILVDDMGWRDLACYGNDIFETPNIDQLAKRGMRFTNAYAPAAMCSPTRYGIQFGQTPARLLKTDKA